MGNTKIKVIIISLFLLIYGDSLMENSLTQQEYSIIVHKSTERPFTGFYNDFSKKGVYHCRNCNASLYNSTDKFASTCGWPSFDDEIDNAITHKTDSDGERVEILCSNCGAHLGHIFKGENLTKKNTRHCVNSLSLKFIAEKLTTIDTAYFAGGCFWGVEYYFEQEEGVNRVISGYMGGNLDNPTYKDVSTGKSGHVETVQVTYDRNIVSYEQLAKLFFNIHNPEQADGQGPDIGSQYHSVIFINNSKEQKTAEKLIELLEKKGLKIATKILEKSKFYSGEDYHQDYYIRRNKQPYCHKKVELFK